MVECGSGGVWDGVLFGNYIVDFSRNKRSCGSLRVI